MSRKNRLCGAWLPASTAALALALGIAACGDSNDNNDQGNATASGGQDTASGAGSAADREDIAATMRRVRNQYNGPDGKAYCASLTASGQREMVDFVRNYPNLKANNCAQATESFAKPFIKAGALLTPVRVKRIKINGDKATITMNGGLAGIRSIATFKLARENGSWKVVDPISGTKTRKLPKKYQ